MRFFEVRVIPFCMCLESAFLQRISGLLSLAYAELILIPRDAEDRGLLWALAETRRLAMAKQELKGVLAHYVAARYAVKRWLRCELSPGRSTADETPSRREPPPR